LSIKNNFEANKSIYLLKTAIIKIKNERNTPKRISENNGLRLPAALCISRILNHSSMTFEKFVRNAS